MEIKIKIIDPIGLHARPASIVVQQASKFKSNIKLIANGKEANLKSIMSIMALGVKTNTEITIIADGNDAKEALEKIKKTMQENKLI
ncbi:HPr family phosphocarrier protein [Candidatus Hepatoplasma crinochetorum]|jgi:phosphocarrier protein|uniref:Phosphocarrier protein HPr n=1 Tax=Candidatus Hepatoplasma crinochetorum Av TaxID=1427984 RepID=W8GMB3_9MOLU|nr:HPr family phosphocarrier protein [Candidatus Hepatoplasma crinochetorum]AHK22156.1 Phosphocarrier protein HPr [Candidatus Hepatoplasma crinochetorum Av]BDV02742.1 MAG: phosphocarrier protein HPr [Candidatus Hepatoplasma crinochetorum]